MCHAGRNKNINSFNWGIGLHALNPIKAFFMKKPYPKHRKSRIGSDRWKNLPPLKRFLDNITLNKETDCWEWNKAVGRTGYAAISHNGVRVYAHRFSYVTYIGEIKPNMVICHKCDNPRCVNPFHLFQGTMRDNMQDSMIKGRTKNKRLPELKHGTHKRAVLQHCRCELCVVYKTDFRIMVNKREREKRKNKTL